MEWELIWTFSSLMIGIVALCGLLGRVNEWIYVSRLKGTLQYGTLPPGHLGWPLIGNMFSLFRAFKYGDPESFISNFINRYGRAPMYRTTLYGKPTIIVITTEECKKVLTDDERFVHGYPRSVYDIMGKEGLHGVSVREWKRRRKMMQSPVASQESLTSFVDFIKVVAENSFEEWAKLDNPIEFMIEMRKTVFKALMKVFFGDDEAVYLEKEFSLMTDGLISLPINLPGFAYHNALKARKDIGKLFQEVVRKRMMKARDESNTNNDLLALLMESSDENGNKLNDEEIVNMIIIFMFAGHESTSHIVTWSIIFLEENPHFLQMAKEEQEDIVKGRTSLDIGVTLDEIKQMKYLQKVINETLRIVNLTYGIHRKAKTDVNLNGYTIPRGWTVIAWLRNIHLDPENYENPKNFNPLRWNDDQKVVSFLPFGAGGRFCPGADLAKLQVSIFLHYFLLNYRLQRINSKGKVQYLPSPMPADHCLARIKKLSPSAIPAGK